MEEKVEFSKDEYDALKKLAKERMAYDTLGSKLRASWVLAVATIVLSLWAVSDKILGLFK